MDLNLSHLVRTDCLHAKDFVSTNFIVRRVDVRWANSFDR